MFPFSLDRPSNLAVRFSAIVVVAILAPLSGCKPPEVKPDPAAEVEARAMMQQYDKRPAAEKAAEPSAEKPPQ